MRDKYMSTMCQKDNTHLLQNLQDYSRAVRGLTWQRQVIFTAVSAILFWFFDPTEAIVFFTISMLCEYADLRLSKYVDNIKAGDARAAKRAFTGFLINTIISAATLSIYAVWIGLTESGGGMFTALFFLFSAAIYAAINNHQIVSFLVIRLILYGASFMIMTLRDIIVYQPSLRSPMWLQFVTVVFVMYFVIDCSRVFLRMYRQDLKRLRDLKIEHENAKSALVLKTQFVAVVSHELRTPLTSIKGSIDLINSGMFGELPPRVQSLLVMAGKSSQRLADLVNDLLDLQKLEEGKMSFSMETIDVRTFVANAVQSHQGLAERYDVSLHLQDAGSMPLYIHTDASRLMQVLGNMISNAAKFSPKKGDVFVGLSVTHESVRIYVTDNGLGIPPGSSEKIFERFTQLDSSDQRKFGGTGLGMSISRDIMNALGGTINYDSEPGVGTTFYIELPHPVAFEAS
jgi:signal transduction histidine kinase